MTRSARTAVVFAFGAALVLAGLMLRYYAGEVALRHPNTSTPQGYEYYVGVASDIANNLLLGGLIIEGFAALGWITAPRDDR